MGGMTSNVGRNEWQSMPPLAADAMPVASSSLGIAHARRLRLRLILILRHGLGLWPRTRLGLRLRLILSACHFARHVCRALPACAHHAHACEYVCSNLSWHRFGQCARARLLDLLRPSPRPPALKTSPSTSTLLPRITVALPDIPLVDRCFRVLRDAHPRAPPQVISCIQLVLRDQRLMTSSIDSAGVTTLESSPLPSAGGLSLSVKPCSGPMAVQDGPDHRYIGSDHRQSTRTSWPGSHALPAGHAHSIDRDTFQNHSNPHASRSGSRAGQGSSPLRSR